MWLGRKWSTKEKKEICEKHLKESPGWVIGTIMKELNLLDKIAPTESLDAYRDRRKTALAY
jgi:hypothetical protein